jgi:hypothetical protein
MNEEIRGASGGWYYTARPFVYPALTEHAWTGAIDLRESEGGFNNYYYRIYFAPDGSLLPPVLPTGTVLRDPPEYSAEAK